MKIAATYDNGTVFQHFGHTETMKIYEVEDGKVVKSEVIGTGGAGCGALAGFLAGQGVDVLLCGGIGGGAANHVLSAGIELISGVTGDAGNRPRRLDTDANKGRNPSAWAASPCAVR